MYRTYTGGEAPHIIANQNTQAHSVSKARTLASFGFEIELIKNSEESCVFCIAVMGGLRPLYKYRTKYTSPLRVFDNFNSKAKATATFDFCKIKNAT